jgi:glutathione synthase/RimK-type ligase-like ATP-grasp enzyme
MYLLYHKNSSKTGKLLKEALEVRGGYGKTASEPLIRWGSRKAMDTPTLLNQPEAIDLASDKLLALRTMQDSGVNVPEFTTEPQDGTEVWLGRKRRGYGGTGVLPCSHKSHMQDALRHGDADFFTKYVPNKREYRVHVFRGEVIRVQGKYLDRPEDHTNRYIQNHGQGFGFRTPKLALRPDRTEQAINAVAALGLDFGAVDLLVGEDGLTYVLEVNTAPKCSPLTLERYVEKIKEVLK